jgi:exopolysaccharide production protein ExoQ
MFQVLSGSSSLTRHWPSASAQSTSSVPQKASARVDWRPVQILDIACLMLLILGGTIPILFPAVGTAGSDVTLSAQSGLFRLLYNGISASFLTYFFISAYRNRFRIPIRLGSVRFACVFLVYAAGSLLWGVSPLPPTLLGLMLLTGMFVFAFYLFMQYSPGQLHTLLGVSFASLGAASIAMAVVLPKYGIDTTGNNAAWQGVFGQKNQLGTAMVFSLVCALTLPSDRKSWKVALVAAAVCMLAFALTRGVFRFGSRDRLFMVAAAAILLVATGAAIALNEREFLTLMGRDATFSGRTKIWSAVLHLIAQRPFLGYGLAGAGGTTIWASIQVATGWNVGSGSTHSLYLASLFRFGLVGSAILLSALLLGLRNTLKLVASGAAAQIEFPILLLLGMLVCGVGGHGLFEIPGIQLILMFLALFQLDRQAHPQNLVEN